MLGVAFVAGTFVLTDSLKATFDQIVRGRRAAPTSSSAARGEPSVAGQGDLRQPSRSPRPTRSRGSTASRRHPDLGGSPVLVGKDGTAVRNGRRARASASTTSRRHRALKLVNGRAPPNVRRDRGRVQHPGGVRAGRRRPDPAGRGRLGASRSRSSASSSSPVARPGRRSSASTRRPRVRGSPPTASCSRSGAGRPRA